MKKLLVTAIADGDLIAHCAEQNPDKTWADVENAYPWFDHNGTVAFGEHTFDKSGWFKEWLWAEMQTIGIKQLYIFEEI